jgi:Xaa-Pro aminopeptidase
LALWGHGLDYKHGTGEVTHAKPCWLTGAVPVGYLAGMVAPTMSVWGRRLVVVLTWVQILGAAGHGVGAFLNVHEGPQSISYKKRPYEEGLYPGERAAAPSPHTPHHTLPSPTLLRSPPYRRCAAVMC